MPFYTPHLLFPLHITLAGKRHLHRSYIERLRRDCLIVCSYMRTEYKFGKKKKVDVYLIFGCPQEKWFY